MRKLAVLSVLTLAIVAVPAQAKPTKPPKPPKPAHPAPMKCVAHTESYAVEGTLDSGSLTAGAHGTYSGGLVVLVKHTNDHAKPALGTHASYTLSNAKVNLHHANPAALAAGSRVQLHGTTITLAKKCNQSGFTPLVTIHSADLKPPRPHH